MSHNIKAELEYFFEKKRKYIDFKKETQNSEKKVEDIENTIRYTYIYT